MKTVLVTGSGGLVGSACVRHFAALGWRTIGMDNDERLAFFGESVKPNLKRLYRDFTMHLQLPGDVSSRGCTDPAIALAKPDLVIHAAAQPSHDWAASNPHRDFEVNALGTLNLLEATRQYAPQATFVYLSTNKVYGDRPNELSLKEYVTRYDYGEWAPEERCDGLRCYPENGVDESMRIDATTHSLFGCSKLAADLYVQEYGRYFGMNTACLRCGCLTGGAHAGAEQHGFLAYLVKCCREGRPYTVYGHKGKQVRDNLHASDVARACEAFANNPKKGAVYNLGGGRANSVSVLEAIELAERYTGKKLDWKYSDEARKGDHVCWITDTTRFRNDYPEWSVRVGLEEIFKELADIKGDGNG